MPAADEVEDFVSEVDRVAALIDGISTGRVSIEDYDRMHGRELAKEAAKEALRQAEADAKEASRETDAAELEQRRVAAKAKVRERVLRRAGSRRPDRGPLLLLVAAGGWAGR
jgi:hypothetical protein